MKNKTPLPLMEQLIMVLVFALTAALCLQGFSLADRISRRQEAREKAVVLAQNMAEALKSRSGDLEAASRLLEDFSEDSDFVVQVIPVSTEDPYLDSARIVVTYEEEAIFEITVAWQEVSKNEIP